MIRFALDGITSFSHKPLKVASYLGLSLSFFSFIYLLIVLYQKVFTSTTITGWSSILAVTLFFNGIILVILGVMGEYIGRVYDEAKGRPLYIVSETVGIKSQERSEALVGTR